MTDPDRDPLVRRLTAGNWLFDDEAFKRQLAACATKEARAYLRDVRKAFHETSFEEELDEPGAERDAESDTGDQQKS